MRRRRSLKDPPLPAAIHPCTSDLLLPLPHSMTPNPVRCEPGSMPKMRTAVATGNRTVAGATALAACAAGSKARQDPVRYLGIRVDVLHVVEVLERFEELRHVFRGGAF